MTQTLLHKKRIVVMFPRMFEIKSEYKFAIHGENIDGRLKPVTTS